MKKENDIILISLVMIIVLLLVLVSTSVTLIFGKNGMIQRIKQEEVSAEQIDSGELKI